MGSIKSNNLADIHNNLVENLYIVKTSNPLCSSMSHEALHNHILACTVHMRMY